MSITVDWYSAEKTALIYTYDGSWTWNDYDTVISQGNAMMQSMPYIVHVVVHLKSGVQIPTDVISNRSRQHIEAMTPPNHGKLIVYGLNPVLNLMVSTVKRIAPQWVENRHAVFIHSLDEIADLLAA